MSGFFAEYIAHIESDYKDKFGIPRQSRLVDNLAKIVFEPEYRNIDAVRGLDGYSHLWVLWYFSDNRDRKFRPTVRPPRLGGNARMGVFATRSPYRPNPIGLSCVKIEKIDLNCQNAPIIYVSGADMLDQTPILDIKPYLPFCDSVPDAKGGFAEEKYGYALSVNIPEEYAPIFGDDLDAVRDILAQDPRPSYQDDGSRVYKMDYGEYNIGFTVDNGTAKIVSAIKAKDGGNDEKRS